VQSEIGQKCDKVSVKRRPTVAERRCERFGTRVAERLRTLVVAWGRDQAKGANEAARNHGQQENARKNPKTSPTLRLRYERSEEWIHAGRLSGRPCERRGKQELTLRTSRNRPYSREEQHQKDHLCPHPFCLHRALHLPFSISRGGTSERCVSSNQVVKGRK